MTAPGETQQLFVKQQKEWGEILTGFETLNKYSVTDGKGVEVMKAAELKGNLFLRLFLKAYRPFELYVTDMENNVVLKINRPFRFFFHEADISDGDGNLLGTIKKEFTLLRRIYSVKNAQGKEECKLFGPLLHPWTFQIKKMNTTFGKITKKWSGLMKEGFTDADNFGVEFPTRWDAKIKSLLLGAVFLIDFVHFENKGD